MRIIAAVIVAMLLVAQSACSTAPTTPGASATDTDITVRKSPNDDRDYRYLVLDNGLRVLLVSDPKTDMAAASLTVLRGSLHDPAGYPGLAHFLEHMLFIGTRKYPEVDGYQQFIATHGGSSNAYTAADHTNYFFEVQAASFEPAMDRFAQFFIAPLLDVAYVERERNAVDSEYQMQRKDDGWRGFSALKAAMNPDYTGSRFNIGSLATLGAGVDRALVEFFETNYSADQMILVALGAEPLDALEAWIRPMFVAIDNRGIGPAPLPAPAFTDEQLPGVLGYRTLKAQSGVSFNFPVPATEPHFRKKPAEYLTNLLGHEGEGSLHQRLHAEGWIESLAAGVNRLDARNSILSIDIELTEAGRHAIPAITDALFGYIELLKSRTPEAWRYREQARVAELGFEFQEQSSPMGFVYRTAPALGLYPPEEVLVAPYLMSEFDPGLIVRYLDALTPENVLLEVSGPDVETDSVEAFFEVPYRLAQEPPPLRAPDPNGLHLPEKNPFLPERLELLEADAIGPALALDGPALRLWLDRDVEFGAPRSNQYFTLAVRGGLATPRDVAMAHLYQRLVSDALNRYTYPAYLAGLGYQLAVDGAGFNLFLSGYSDKQAELLDALLDTFTGLTPDAEKFALYRDALIREWSDFRNERPYTQTFAALGQLLLSDTFDPAILAGELESIELADLVDWRRARLDEFAVEGISHGNVDRAALEEIAAHLEANLPLAPFAQYKSELAEIQAPWLLERDVQHDDASMVLYVQDPEASFEQRARSALAGQILQQAYFTELRTEQQLGYVVSLANRTYRDRGGLIFVIQSPVASPAVLERATLEFMREQLEALRVMDVAAFEAHRAGLVGRLTELDRNLRERTQRYWADLDAGVTSFDSQATIARIVERLSREDLVGYVEAVVDRLESRRVLVYNLGRFQDAPSLGIRLNAADWLGARSGAGATAR